MRKLTNEEISQRRIPAHRIASAERFPIFTLLDNIRSMYNVGSIFRTSDGALIKELYLCGYTPTPPRKEILKTAIGSVETVPWSFFKDPLDAIKAAREQGAKICLLEHTSESIPYHQVRRTDFPLCLILGNELTGVSSEVAAAADMAIEIPMYGTKQSLNAAVAYGIAVFDLVRIWKGESTEQHHTRA